jgi:hypothetical protein
VVDAASVDGRRRLVLIRRDNIEHLLMIGGPGDVVIEQNIVRAAAAREVSREPARSAVPGETLPRAVPLADVGSWPLQPEAPANVAPAARSPARPIATDEPWVAPPDVAPPARPRAPDDFVPPPHDFTARPSEQRAAPPRPVPPVVPPVAMTPPAPMARPAPPPAPLVAPVTRDAPPAEAPPAASGDHNLADMAQQLEAALRRPGGDERRPPVTDPLAAAMNAPPKPPEPPRTASRDAKAPTAEPAPAAKPSYESLEQEMASLLGRSTGKT